MRYPAAWASAASWLVLTFQGTLPHATADEFLAEPFGPGGPPNALLFLIDDLGQTDAACYGDAIRPVPAKDSVRLARSRPASPGKRKDTPP